MTLDASIYSQIQQPKPVNMLADYANLMQVQGAQQANQLNALKVGAYQRDQERQNRLTSLLQNTPDDQVESTLMRSGYLKEGMEFGKARQDRAKSEADARASSLGAAQKQLELAGQAFGFVRANPTLENAHRTLDYLGANGVYSAEQVAQFKQMTAQDPSQIGALADQAFRAALSAKEQLPKLLTTNTGGFSVNQAVDPFTGQATETGRIQNTQSPDSAASVAATIRGQNLADARAREQPRGVLDTERGLLVDPRTGQARPVMMNGQAVGMKVAPEARKELMSVNQQRASISGAIQAAEKSPTAFGFWRGLAASLPGGETIAGRMETMDETQARAYVFNNVSRIINERAGAAQSAQELARLNQFLPAASDNQTQIVNKLKGFNKYLDDLERGTRTPTGAGAPAGNTGGASGSFGDDPLGLRL